MTGSSPAPVPAPAPALPSGQCNFVDLTQGATGPRCGCRRFWSRAAVSQDPRGSPRGFSPYSQGLSLGQTAVDQTAWCMCSHHACFHDDIRESQTPTPTPPPVFMAPPPNPGQENERPRSIREPLTPVLPELSFHMPPPHAPSTPAPAGDFHTFNKASYPGDFGEGAYALPEEHTVPAKEPSIPDTMSWGHFIQSQPSQPTNLMPTVSSQCLLPSQPSSTTSSVRRKYLAPFHGKGLQTLSGAKSKSRTPLAEGPEDARGHNALPVEPSSAASVDGSPTVANTPRSIRRAEEKHPDPIDAPRGRDLQVLSKTVQIHDERLERLENVSFDGSAHEECYDKHDHMDLRVTELESRVEELENALNDESSDAGCTGGRRASITSASTDTSERAELYDELRDLRAELNRLQRLSIPTHAKPWEVEVVFLPFPLKGVWQEPHEFTSQRAPSGGSLLDADEWTQLPSSSTTMPPPPSPAFHEWRGPEADSEWLLPRACPPDGIIEQRLRSRGLVKMVAIRGPDARSVQQALSTAFGGLGPFSRVQTIGHHGATALSKASQFLGLQQPWVPLRKIHKDSRLRFLSPAEMITPATWDVAFLSSSVVMKATGVQRMYLTQPEAYIQDQDAFGNGWSWQRLRELSRVYPDSQSIELAVPEADAMEDCWSHNERIDDSPSSETSGSIFSQRQAAQPRLRTTSISPSPLVFCQSHTAQTPPFSGGPRSRGPSPFVPLQERRPSVSRPPQVRTNSVPPTNLPALASPGHARRRLMSVGLGNSRVKSHDRHTSQQLRANSSMAHVYAMTKRRRDTRSPSIPISARFRRTTPRWSTTSPSPMPDALAYGAGYRQTTPFYATPFSNAPYVDLRAHGGVMEVEEERGSETESDSGEENDSDGSAMLDLGHPRRRRDEDEIWQDVLQGAQPQPLPEDEPWPGIEDEENQDPEASFQSVDVFVDGDAAMSDVDFDATDEEATEPDEEAMEEAMEAATEAAMGPGPNGIEEDCASQHSSVPSEYPSTQAWAEGASETRVSGDRIEGKR